MDVASSLSDNYDEKYDEDELNIKIETEEKMDIIEKALDKTKVTGFEAEIFKLYYYKDYTYRKIEKETGVDHVLAYVTVKKVLNKVKKQIGKNNIY